MPAIPNSLLHIHHSRFTKESYNPLMRRRWKALIAVGAVAFAIPCSYGYDPHALGPSQTFVGVDVRDRIGRTTLENVLLRRGFTFTQVGTLELQYVVTGRADQVLKVLELEMPRSTYNLAYEGRKIADFPDSHSPGISVSATTQLRFPFDVLQVLRLTEEPKSEWVLAYRPVPVWIDMKTQAMAYDIQLTKSGRRVRFQAMPNRQGGLAFHQYAWPQPPNR
jgi:hypothetical protein